MGTGNKPDWSRHKNHPIRKGAKVPVDEDNKPGEDMKIYFNFFASENFKKCPWGIMNVRETGPKGADLALKPLPRIYSRCHSLCPKTVFGEPQCRKQKWVSSS